MEWRVLLVLLFAVSFSFALPTGQLDTEENEDQDFADFEDAQEELEDFPDEEEEQEDYPGCTDSKKYWCIARKHKCSDYDVYKHCKRTCKRCPRNGNWSPYGPYSKCSKPCGGGKQYRSRTCSKPSPAYGGKKCPGFPKQSRDCNKQHCPVDGEWSEWGNWGTCSKSCGGGSQSRSRTCTNPAPAYGGKSCKGPSEETRACNKDKCPVDGGWSPWGDYGRCSVICSGGSQSRSRTCTNPAPANGGKNCEGKKEETRGCNTKPCPGAGEWSPWGDYGKCSVSCGGGSQSRSRSCTNPPPTYGGPSCIGPSTQTHDCNKQPCPACHDIKSYYYCNGIAKKYKCGIYKYYKDCKKTCKKCH